MNEGHLQYFGRGEDTYMQMFSGRTCKKPTALEMIAVL
jgi:hypothetical protein